MENPVDEIIQSRLEFDTWLQESAVSFREGIRKVKENITGVNIFYLILFIIVFGIFFNIAEMIKYNFKKEKDKANSSQILIGWNLAGALLFYFIFNLLVFLFPNSNLTIDLRSSFDSGAPVSVIIIGVIFGILVGFSSSEEQTNESKN